jgi:hypothetical protein
MQDPVYDLPRKPILRTLVNEVLLGVRCAPVDRCNLFARNVLR